MAQALPDSRFEILPGAGHTYLLAHRERTNRLVLDILRQVDGEGATWPIAVRSARKIGLSLCTG